MFSPSACKFLSVTGLSLVLLLSACSDDAVEDANRPTSTSTTGICPAPQTRNPITGECIGAGSTCPPGQVFNAVVGACIPTAGPADMGQDDMGPGGPADMPSAGDASSTDGGRLLPDMKKVVVDVPAEDRCKEGLDSDGDGLNNKCECDLGTEPGNSDTDDDGLPDGYEDANMNCMIDGGETQPTAADTDSDGLSDGEEVLHPEPTNPLDFDTDDDGITDGIERGSCTDPLKADTDDDGIEDGREDTNRDGFIGICQNRVYDPVCAQGEYDPCKPDTDGDKIPDGQEVNFLGCRQEFLDAIPAPTLLENAVADYKFALETATTHAPLPGVNAHAFNHDQEQYAGFILSFAKPIAAGTIEQQRDALLARIRTTLPGARFESSGRRTVTHDLFDSFSRLQITLDFNERADTIRDRVLVALSGAPVANHGLTGNFIASADSQTMVFSLIDRGPALIVTAAFTSLGRYNDRGSRTGFLIDDIGSPNSVAKVSEKLENACTTYEVETKPKADFLWILDGSASMKDKNTNVKKNITAFTQILQRSNIDWRLGVTSAACSAIANDAALPADVKALFQGKCLSSFGSGDHSNGKLCGNSFTIDVNQFVGCVDKIIGSGGTEYTGTIAAAAIGRALPRTAGVGGKLRPDAALVVISVTDEFDDFFEVAMNWKDTYSSPAGPSDPTVNGVRNQPKLDMITKPFLDFFRKDEVRATLFGILWSTGQKACSSRLEAAIGIETLAIQTGGAVGDICQDDLNSTLTRIAQASVGLASGLRLQGIPITPTLQIRVGDVVAQQLKTPARSRVDGWDYDAVPNAAVFLGPSAPKIKDRVVITYKRWENSDKTCKTQADCKSDFQKLQCRNGLCI